ncbi:MAG: glycosyltransferase, partial [Kiritimatiellae bacterium]|nr:glycosyltransferase [Kiritimatiellia bacterium]
MNVLHVIDSLDPVRGGPQVVVPSLAAAQAAMGHRVLILSNHPARAEAAVARQLREIPGSERVEVINLRHPNLIEKCLALIAGKRLRNVISGETFVHLHGVWEPMLWAVADIACHRGVPYAVRLCGILQPGQMNRYRVFKEVVFRLGARRMLHRASFVHALTEAEARFARPYIGNTPVEVIPNGVFPERFANLPPPGEFYRRHPDLQGHPYILFLSRLHPHKGILLLADAFALLASKLPEIHLVVAGPDGGEKTKFEQKM